MLIFIGGAARTGKGILSRRILTERQFPFLSLDVLKMGLARGVPEFSIDPDAGGIQVAERLWPLVKEMSVSLLHDQMDHVFEGEILPKNVEVLRRAYPTQVRASFLGYCTITPVQKLHEIRKHSGYPNDWPQEHTDVDLLKIINREIKFSQYLQSECVKYHHFRYFDLSHNFMQMLDHVVDYLQGGRVSSR